MTTRIKKSLYPEKLTTPQEEVLTGLLLGDAYLCRDLARGANTHLSVGRSSTDAEYNAWLAVIFSNMLTQKSLTERDVYDIRTDKTYHNSTFRTKTCVVLNDYHTVWYQAGTKCVPESLILTPLTIAVWLCDDGSVMDKGNSRMNIRFATNGFTKSEVETLSQLLCKRYNGTFHPSKAENGQYVIEGADDATRKLLQEIDSVFPPCMNRKMIWRKEDMRFYSNQPVSFRSYTSIRAERLPIFLDIIINSDSFTIPYICETLGWFRKTKGREKTIPSFIKLNYMPKLINLGLIEKIGMRSDNKTIVFVKTSKGVATLSLIRQAGKFPKI